MSTIVPERVAKARMKRARRHRMRCAAVTRNTTKSLMVRAALLHHVLHTLHGIRHDDRPRRIIVEDGILLRSIVAELVARGSTLPWSCDLCTPKGNP